MSATALHPQIYVNVLRANGFDYEFNTWINTAYSFGQSGLDDDIEEYIKENQRVIGKC